MTRTGKSSIFSGMVYCADCGSKIYAVVAGIYLAVTYAVYAVRYAKAKKRLNLYLEYLDCLEEGTDAIERG